MNEYNKYSISLTRAEKKRELEDRSYSEPKRRKIEVEGGERRVTRQQTRNNEKLMEMRVSDVNTLFVKEEWDKVKIVANMGIESHLVLDIKKIKLFYILSLACYIRGEYNEVQRIVDIGIEFWNFSKKEKEMLYQIGYLARFEQDQCGEGRKLDEVIMNLISLGWEYRVRLHCILYDIYLEGDEERAVLSILSALRYVKYIEDIDLRQEVVVRINKCRNLKELENKLSSDMFEESEVSQEYRLRALDVLKLVNGKTFYFM